MTSPEKDAAFWLYYALRAERAEAEADGDLAWAVRLDDALDLAFDDWQSTP